MGKVPSWLRHGRCAEDWQGMAVIIMIITTVSPFMAIIHNEAGAAKLPSHVHFPSSFGKKAGCVWGCEHTHFPDSLAARLIM